MRTRWLSLLVLAWGCARAGPTRAPTHGHAAVQIHWDRWQVPHVFADDRAGIAYGLGYAQLRAYPDEILRLYAVARGEAAAVWGRAALESDRRVRTLGIPGHGTDALAAMQPAVRAELEAFAAGMNDFAAAHPERLSAESRAVLPVRAADPLAHGHRVLLAFALQAGHRSAIMDLAPPVAGSNGWAIAPSRSTSGNALLLVNPHLPWHSPATRLFEAHLVGPDAPLYGCTLLGFPTLTIGFNDAVAWTHTINTIDVADVYALVPDGDGYRFDGQTRDFEVHDELVRVRGEDGTVHGETLQIRRSIHGPVLTSDDGRVVAVRTGLDDDDAGWLGTWSALGRARDLQEFEAGLASLGLPMFTVVYADRDGHILYVSAGRVPRRPAELAQGEAPRGWFDVAAGDTAKTLSTGVLPYDALVRIVDPPGGFVQNSNSVPWFATIPAALDPADYADLHIAAGPLGMREIHGLRLLGTGAPIDFAALRTMQRSVRLELADHVLDALLAAASLSDDASIRAAATVLAAWDRRAGTPGAVLFAEWAAHVAEPSAFAEPWSPMRPLDAPADLADPTAALAALRTAADALVAHHGTLAPEWSASHRLSATLPGVGGPGDLGSFHVVDYGPDAQGERRPIGGDTFIAIVEMRPEGPHAEVLLTYGNTSPTAPFAVDQLDLLATGRLREALLDRRVIAAQAVHSVRLVPTRRASR